MIDETQTDNSEQQTDNSTSSGDAQPSNQEVYDAVAQVMPPGTPPEKIEQGVEYFKNEEGWTNQQIIEQGVPILKTPMGQKLIATGLQQANANPTPDSSSTPNIQTSLTENANANPTMAAQAANATQPIAPLNQDASQVQLPLWAAGPALAAYPQAMKEQQEGAAIIANQNQKAQQQANANQQQQIAAQENAQKNVGFQQAQSIQQQMLDPNSVISKATQTAAKNLLGLDLTGVPAAVAKQSMGDNLFQLLLQNSGYGSYNNKLAAQAGDYGADITGFNTAIEAGKNATNTAKGLVDSLQKDGKWNATILQAGFDAAKSPDAWARWASSGVDPRYIDIVHTAQTAGMAYGKLSGSGTDYGNQMVQNAVLNPVDPVKSLTAMTTTMQNQFNTAKSRFEWGQTHGQNYSGWTPPPQENPYPNEKTSTTNNTTPVTNKSGTILMKNKDGVVGNVPIGKKDAALKAGYTIVGGQ